jgi:hypothetical protein
MTERDEIFGTVCPQSCMLNVEAVGATSRCYTNDDDSRTNRLHTMRPTGCIHALHYRIIIMYAPFALASPTRASQLPAASQFASPAMPVDGCLCSVSWIPLHE